MCFQLSFHLCFQLWVHQKRPNSARGTPRDCPRASKSAPKCVQKTLDIFPRALGTPFVCDYRQKHLARASRSDLKANCHGFLKRPSATRICGHTLSQECVAAFFARACAEQLHARTSIFVRQAIVLQGFTRIGVLRRDRARDARTRGIRAQRARK